MVPAVGLNRDEAHTDTENAETIRMLRRPGLRREGTFHDVALFALLRSQRG